MTEGAIREKEEQEARAWLRTSQEKLQVLFNDFFF